MLLELHILQNFAPSNLNRDDTGAPKDCEFGGYRRARISSQCLKRGVRTAFRDTALVPKANLATRTKRLTERLVELMAVQGRDETQSRAVARAALQAVGLRVKDDNKTEYLLFVGDAEIGSLAEACHQHWDALTAVANADDSSLSDQPSPRPSARDAKKAGKAAVPPDVRNALDKTLNGGGAADLALFGRMVADRPERNVDAACQVAHAISTNKVSVEFDFYTAVDDLRPQETAGADMMGTVEFNSACFYRYANLDASELRRNLDGDEALARQAVEAFLRASVAAVPTGKQNSMAAQNPPSLVLAVVREAGFWNLANAFTNPVRPDGHADLVQNSIQRLCAYWDALSRMYGDKQVIGRWVTALEEDGLGPLAGARVENLEQLIEQAGAATFRENGRSSA